MYEGFPSIVEASISVYVVPPSPSFLKSLNPKTEHPPLDSGCDQVKVIEVAVAVTNAGALSEIGVVQV